jgi:hypothetical protein
MGDSLDTPDHGHRLAIDPKARSRESGVPAFMARPVGTPLYHGFPVLDDVEVDGFKFGMITDFENSECTSGDAFVVAPDGNRAGIVWQVNTKGEFREILPFDRERWGVWFVSFPHPMRSRRDAQQNLQAVLPRLKEQWDRWKTGSL